ncbi:MAG TPA: D-alanyl-D-alanine carboxypeptidase/D-alanyl-D-alanine-endopeptidase [Pyrinomonadaceae bacterium]
MRIRNQPSSRFVALLLLLSIGFTPVVSLRAQEARPTQQQRERRVATPSTTTTGAPVPTPTPFVAPTPSALSASTATANVPGALRTIEELRTRISDTLRRSEIAPSQLAVKVASLDTGRILYEENAGKLLLPASNMKIYTVAAALDRLSPDYRYTTSVYANARPDDAGTLRGDLIVYGRGDPTFAASFNGGDYYKAIDDLAARIIAGGVKRVEGNLVGDESYFTGPPLGWGWEWDDLQSADGAEVSALTVNNNALDVFVRPGASVGSPATVTTGPVTSVVRIVNRVTTSARGTKRDVAVVRPLGENVLEVSGSVPLSNVEPSDKGYVGSFAITHPALLFVDLLRTSLAQRGVIVSGQTKTINARERGNLPLQTSSLVEIASIQSQPLSVIAAQCLKPSQNLYAELLLRTLGRVAGTVDPKVITADAGSQVIRTFLREAGIGPREIVIADGSGLSRHNLITADATMRLLIYMSRHRYASTFREALPIAGVDGTLKNRMKGTPAERNLRAKTGTINTVATLSGYVTSAAGERLVFSVLLNNYPEAPSERRVYLDTIAVALASFAGHS